MLSPEERHKILIEFNDTELSFPTNQTVENLFVIQAKKTPDATAAIIEGEDLSYGELNSRADYLAHRLSGLGVEPGDVVGLCFERSLEYLFALFAVLKVGAAFVPLDSDHPDRRLLYQIEDTEAKLVLSHSALNPRLAGCKAQRIYVDKFNWAQSNHAQKAFPTAASADSPLCVMYTSGSTGQPKGVKISQLGVLNLLHWLQVEYRITPEHRSLQASSIGFDHSIIEVFWPLVNGATLIIAKQGGQGNADYLVKTIQDQSVTHLSTVPSLLRAMLDIPKVSGCKTLQFVCCLGEALRVDLNEKFHQTIHAKLHNWYGPTETTVFSTFWQSVPGAKTISIGKPISNTQIYLLDESGDPVSVGTSGEIYIGGVGVAPGYLNLPVQTAESFVRNPFSEGKEDTLYRTGDLAKFHTDGTLEFLGRKDRQIQLRGIRIEPGEIESLLNRRSDISESAVVLKEHGPNDMRLHAFYVSFSEEERSEPAELKDYLTSQLPEVMVPSFITRLDALPHTVSGKLDRKSLISDSPFKPTSKPPAVDQSVAASIATIFEDILEYKPVKTTDSFFELGGHSLLAMKINNEINNQFQVDLSMDVIFKKETPAELAKCVQQKKNNP
ncbi:MAG: non-ribosomal peptide synthetase [Verrucomicrobia bacterium]|nr:non-ribosomal peptide synthetase [Verrucomicrobiota bacterium]